MQRDMDLIRQILFKVEERPVFEHIMARSITVDGYDQGTVIYHVAQLIEAGFLDGQVLGTFDGGIPECMITSMSWEGHEFIDAARADTIWNSAKERGKKVAGNISVATMKALLIAEAARLFGIG